MRANNRLRELVGNRPLRSNGLYKKYKSPLGSNELVWQWLESSG
jgi:hypothetical protein